MDDDGLVTPLGDAVVSWSGGKDACLAMLRAREQGWRIVGLMTGFDPPADSSPGAAPDATLNAIPDATPDTLPDGPEPGPSKSHALPLSLIQAQADALGLPLSVLCCGWADYEAALKAQMVAAADQGARAWVFGDIHLQAHRDWYERICAEQGVTAVFPLWGEPTADLAREVIQRGIRALLVCTQQAIAELCGRWFDEQLLALLPAGVDPCGEYGEFHTLVVDAPGMQAPIPVNVNGLRWRVAFPGVPAIAQQPDVRQLDLT